MSVFLQQLGSIPFVLIICLAGLLGFFAGGGRGYTSLESLTFPVASTATCPPCDCHKQAVGQIRVVAQAEDPAFESAGETM